MTPPFGSPPEEGLGEAGGTQGGFASSWHDYLQNDIFNWLFVDGAIHSVRIGDGAFKTWSRTVFKRDCYPGVAKYRVELNFKADIARHFLPRAIIPPAGGQGVDQLQK